MFMVKKSLFKYSIISLKEDFIKNPWKGRLKRCSAGDMDQYKNWSPKVISRVNICAKKEHFQYRERMIEELDGDTGWHELVNLGYRDEYDQKKFFFWRENVLVQDFSILYLTVNHLGSCEKRNYFQWVCSGYRISTSQTSSKMMPVFLVHGPHLEHSKDLASAPWLPSV